MSGGNRSHFSLFEILLNIIYPESCPACSASIRPKKTDVQKPKLEELGTLAESDAGDFFFCPDCQGKIRRLEGPSCRICAMPYPAELAPLNGSRDECSDCREDPPFFEKAITPYCYEGPLKEAVRRLKYQQKTKLALCLANLLITELTEVNVDLVMAIPLHPQRLRAREFNQSLLLVKEISHVRGWPMEIDSFRRIRKTDSQVGLSKEARKKNIKNAFSVARPASIAGRRILLIDDVYTTGSTLKEGAKTLINAGAKTVIVAAPTRMVFSPPSTIEISGQKKLH